MAPAAPRRRSGRLRCARPASATLVASALLLGLAASGAQARWSAPVVVANGDEAGLSGAGLLADGRLRVAFYDRVHNVGLGLVDGSAASPFSDPRILLRPPALAYTTALAADGSGIALQAVGRRIRAVPFDAAGTAGTSFDPGRTARDVALAVSPAGAAALAWVRPVGRAWEVVAAFRDVGAPAFGEPVRAGFTAEGDTLVSTGIGDSGETVVSWQVNQFPSAVAAAVRLPGQGFSRPRYVTRRGTLVDLAVGADGTAILSAPDGGRMRVAIKPAGGASMPAVRTIDRAPFGFESHVAAATGGRVGLVWPVSDRRERTTVRVYLGTSATGVHRAATLGPGTGEADLAVGGDGSAAVGWESEVRKLPGDPSARSRFDVAYKPAGKRFETTTRLRPVALSSTPLGIVVAGGGRAFALFESYQSGDRRPRDAFRRVYVTERAP